MKILIIGPQGSGKTTQAKILADKFNLCHISSGDLARQIAIEDSDRGRQFKAALDQGEMVDDHILAEAIKEKIASLICQNGFVLDGYPRRLSQITAFDPQPEIAFDLEVSPETSWQRLSKREREDDTPQLVRQRLQLYHDRTKPVIDHYQNLGKLIKINAEGEVGQVYQQILSHLNHS